MHERRGFIARLGISLLNFLVPGLGLLRLRCPRLAFAYWLMLPASEILLGIFWAATGICHFLC